MPSFLDTPHVVVLSEARENVEALLAAVGEDFREAVSSAALD